MALELANIKEEFLNLVSSQLPPVFWRYSAELLLATKTYYFTEVMAVSIVRDYSKDHSEATVITVSLPITTYRNILLKNKRHIRVKLKRELATMDGDIQGAPESITKEYKAVVANPIDSTLMPQARGEDDEGLNDVSNIVTVKLQLLEDNLNEMRLSSEAGIFSNCTLADCMRYVMAHKLTDSEVATSLLRRDYIGVRGVQLEPPSNDTAYEDLILPSGIKTVDVPQFLQKNFGVYSSGIGYFLQDGWWFIYPLYDYTRFNPNKKTLTVILLSEDELPTCERTYMYRSEQLMVFSTGQKISVDYSEYMYNNYGNALKFFLANKLVDGTFTVSENIATPNHSDIVQNFSIRERDDGLNNITQPDRNFTDNPFVISSELSRNLGRHVIVNWDNCNPDLLFPGMPTKILYAVGGETKSILGTLLAVDIHSSPSTEAVIDKDFKTSAVLTLFIEPENI